MKQWLLVLCIILVGTAVAKKPHILYVVADDQGYGDMGKFCSIFDYLISLSVCFIPILFVSRPLYLRTYIK